jgi:uncharacterized integral membrane protein
VSDEVSPPREDRPGAASREIPWKLVAWIALAVYAVVFLLLNDERQDVSFVFFTIRTRLIWLILLSMALGAALAVVLPRWWRSRKLR